MLALDITLGAFTQYGVIAAEKEVALTSPFPARRARYWRRPKLGRRALFYATANRASNAALHENGDYKIAAWGLAAT